MNIETYISDLLYRHDCVIIPGLGGIITNYRSAQIHPVSHKLQPPSKSIRFNLKLREDDGLLANYVSSCESISYASAKSKIEHFVFSIYNDLEHKKEARLPKIGVLSVDLNGILSFEPNLKINYLPDAFGFKCRKYRRKSCKYSENSSFRRRFGTNGSGYFRHQGFHEKDRHRRRW